MGLIRMNWCDFGSRWGRDWHCDWQQAEREREGGIFIADHFANLQFLHFGGFSRFVKVFNYWKTKRKLYWHRKTLITLLIALELKPGSDSILLLFTFASAVWKSIIAGEDMTIVGIKTAQGNNSRSLLTLL